MTNFQSRREDHIEAVHALHARVPLSATLGIELTAVTSGEVSAARRIYFTEAEVYAGDGAGEKLVATVSATMTTV